MPLPTSKPMAERPSGAIALRERRVAAGLSMDTLARLSGIKKPTIARIETGVYRLSDYYQAKLTAAIESAKEQR